MRADPALFFFNSRIIDSSCKKHPQV